MKKFFKILRKIIKILLKIILWLIIGIIVIVTIGLVILNNRTLKLYENDDGNIRFTMSKDFKVKDGSEITLNLKDGIIVENEMYDGEIGYKYVIKINLKEGIITCDGIDSDYEIPGGYIEEQYIIKLKKLKLKDVKQGYENGDIYNVFEIFRFFIDGEEIRYHDNGQIEEKYNYVNGLENGQYFSYYENGQIEEEGNYIDGDEFGIRTGYYENGNIAYIENLDIDIETGYYEDGSIKYNKNSEVVTGYYENGNIKYIMNKSGYNTYYENGNLFGEFHCKNGYFSVEYYHCIRDNFGNGTGYYIDGNIFSYFTGTYINLDNNHSDFSYIYIDKNGDIMGKYQEYNGLYIDMYENGQIKSKGNIISGDYNGGKNDGYRIRYFNNGQVKSEVFYENGYITHGTGYYKNGNIVNTINFNDDKIGYGVYYDENGNILGNLNINDYKIEEMNYGFFVDYNLSGFIINRYYNGQIMEKGNFIDGKNDGYRVSYYEDGKIKLEGNYKDGIRVGTRNRYLGDGTIGVSKNYDE